ncbi:MOSC domain-containing protein [Hymenobacter sp. BT770]|uniref:MOSC domain-containing protein n=1 Tax=Hymenobacter sp. BT770 TaxID=2886942 RepID=UPI001D128F85|nr:MOSC N-terminal beta barrel domain-containing protein [Hymenobacter sp. BT770]MCC3151997.1 MOSC domain-containing protein [Hymenobacter sp. BT770]MDO3417107.1 MOSC domain-containing protein [Hymenobacter sp. BT770]
MSDALTLTGLYLYPVKSLGGYPVPEADVTARGLRYDRRWLLVDERNRFMTQRQQPELALLTVAPAYNGFLISHRQRPDLLPLFVPFEATPERTLFVTIWDDMAWAWRATPEADEWMAEALGRPCRLVYMSDMVRRDVEPELNPEGQLVSFADAYPFLLIGETALADLNARLAEPVPMNRFRPNLVFEGGVAYEDDNWADFQIGTVPFRAVRGCGRCVLTTIDQQTAIKSPVGDPLRTLFTYRQVDNNAMFGQNVTGYGAGRLRVGDALTVLSYK